MPDPGDVTPARTSTVTRALAGAALVNRTLAGLWSLFWLLMIVVAIEDNRHSDISWWQPLLWEGSSCLWATAALLLERRAAPRWQGLLSEPRRWFLWHLAWLPLVAVVFIGAIYATRHGVYALAGRVYEHDGWAYTFFYEILKLVLFASLWLAIIFGLESFARWREDRERLLALQRHLAETQLAQLRAQLQPHFLFNALNTISSLMQVDVERADSLLAQLADLLRASLQTSARQTTSLRDEIDLVRRYAAIMQARYAERVTVTWDVAPEAGDAEVPAMLLQPLLENAFKHGVEPSLEPVQIHIAAQRTSADLCITVRNSASTLAINPGGGVTGGSAPGSVAPGGIASAGIASGGIASGGGVTGGIAPGGIAPGGIGLANCRERLALLYGEAARLDLTRDGDGVVATLTQPWRSAPT